MKKALFCYILLSVFYFSCKNECISEKKMAGFYLPEYRSEDFGNLELEYWKIKYIYADYTEEILVPSNQKKIYLDVCNNTVISIIASPITKIGSNVRDFLMPAGCIYPFQNKISWLHGFSATILSDFYIHSINAGTKINDILNCVNKFNWKKFIQVIEEKNFSTSTFYNPWNLDRTTILNAISNGYFSSSYLTQSDCYQVESYKIENEVEKKIQLFKENKTCNFTENFSLISTYYPQNIYIKQFSFILTKSNIQTCFLYKSELKELIFIFVTIYKGKEISLALKSNTI